MPVDVNTTGHRTAKTKTATERIKTRLETVFRALDLTDDAQVSLLFTGDDEIQELNRKWRQIDRPTDVLSFPAYPAGELPENPRHLGDIVISVPCAKRLADAEDHCRRVAEELDVDPDRLDWTLDDELAFLFAHGLLHLVGYDHRTASEESRMRAMERRLWQLLSD